MGEDTRFGVRNSGNVETLRQLGAKYGFDNLLICTIMAGGLLVIHSVQPHIHNMLDMLKIDRAFVNDMARPGRSLAAAPWVVTIAVLFVVPWLDRSPVRSATRKSATSTSVT